MSAPLTVQYPPGTGSWVFHAPTDPWGDGYVAELHVELHDQGLSAQHAITLSWPTGNGDMDLVAFFRQLANDWRGWDGERAWRSLDADMWITAQHDGTGHVRLAASLQREPASPDGWLARVSVIVEAGEQMRSLAADVRAHFACLAT